MTRDPPSRASDLTPVTGSLSVAPAGREPTQSLHIEPSEDAGDDTGGDDAHADLARGTHNRVITRIESPGGRAKTPGPPSLPPAPDARRFDKPEDYLGSVLGSYRIAALLGKGGMG